MADPIQPCWFTRAEVVEAVLVDDGTDLDALATWAAVASKHTDDQPGAGA